jgi:hypothetical protein
MGNKEKLDNFLKWAEEYNKINKLSLKGFWTYDNEYFSADYIDFLTEEKIIILNENMGKEVDPSTLDISGLKDSNLPNKEEIGKMVQQLAAKNASAAWYYKGKGKLYDLNTDLSVFNITQDILSGNSKQYQVHADWFGPYFLTLASLTGKKRHEKVFNLGQLYSLRKFIEKEKPKAAVLS